MKNELQLLERIEQLKEDLAVLEKQKKLLWDAVDLMSSIGFPPPKSGGIDFETTEKQFGRIGDAGRKVMQEVIALNKELHQQ